MSDHPMMNVVEAVLLAAGRPVTVEQILELFEEHERPAAEDVGAALAELAERFEGTGIELREVASGWLVQVRTQYADVVSRLWQERPSRYSGALLETLALIAYRQPITRGEIEEIRGVTVSSTIMRTLHERSWIRVVGLLTIATPRGQVQMKARISDEVHRGSIRIAWGWGDINSSWNLNDLTDDDRRGAIPCTPSNRSFMCRIDKVTQ